MTKKELNLLTEEEVLQLAVKQCAKVNEIRGYSSGMTEDRLRLLGKDVLVKCILSDQKIYGIPVESLVVE